MTDHSPNPFDNQTFRDEMSKMFDVKLGDIKSKVDAHEIYIQQQRGGGMWIRYLINGVIALVGGWLGAKAH